MGARFGVFLLFFRDFRNVFFHVFFVGSLFHTFCEFGAPGAVKADAFSINFEHFSVIKRIIKTMFSLGSRHDSAGPRASQNQRFLIFFEVLN